jgi:hypothetical protein
MALQTKGGFPVIQNFSNVSSTGFKLIAPARTIYVQIFNTGAQALEIYTEQEKFDADTDGRTIAATNGVYEGPAEVVALWLKAASSTTNITVIWYARRG